MKKIILSESERERILGMHYNAMGKTLVNEQNIPSDMWEKYVEAANDRKPDTRKITTPPDLLSVEQMNKYKLYDVAFYVDQQNGGTKQVQYQCIDSEPGEKVFKANKIYDSSMNLTNIDKELDASGVEWRQMFTWACKPAMAVLAARKAKEQPQPQVAAATTDKVVAPNPVSDAEVQAVEKQRADRAAKREQANIDLKTLMSSPSGFLKYFDSNGDLITDKTTLDTQVKELNRVLSDGAYLTDPISKQDLLRSMRNLVRNFPEYGEAPYYLNSHIATLKDNF